jgi:hypothetical protein
LFSGLQSLVDQPNILSCFIWLRLFCRFQRCRVSFIQASSHTTSLNPTTTTTTTTTTTMSEEWPSAAWVGAPDTEAGASVNVDDYAETLSFLRCFDTMFLVDDSAHMAPYWGDVQTLLDRIVPICARHDPDGIDIYFVNHRPKKMMGLMTSKSARRSGYRGIGAPGSKDSVKSVFSKVKPTGQCLLGARLAKLLDWYTSLLKADDEGAALNVIVITAGMFDDDVRAPLVNVARTLDQMHLPEHQVGIQLFQIGGPGSAEVQRNLEYLDDELHKETGTRDIVDTTTWDGGVLSTDDLLKVILGAVVKKLDERSSALKLDASAPAIRVGNESD